MAEIDVEHSGIATGCPQEIKRHGDVTGRTNHIETRPHEGVCDFYRHKGFVLDD
jgi:hypothetical protein